MHTKTVALINPPGWTLATGAPHLGLPLLAHPLRQRGHAVFLADWNVELARLFGARISEQDARAVFDLDYKPSMHEPYFDAQQALINGLGGDTTASWDPQMGYADAKYDASNPADIRKALSIRSPLDASLNRLAEHLLSECRPDLIGLSLSVQGQVLPSFYAARALRRCGFTGPIVLGGNIVTRLGSAMAEEWVFDYFDALVVLQGELVLPELCLASKRAEWARIPNLLWKDAGTIRANRSEVLSPQEFGPPDFRGLPLKDYWGAQFLTAVGSRGCYYGKCSFCSIPYAWGNGGFLGNDTPSAIVSQFETGIARHGVHRYKFVDEALHPGLLSYVSDRVLASGLDVEFEGYARLDQSWLTPGLLRRFARAGLKKLYIGLEIAASNSRELLRKADHADPATFLTALSDHGISAHVFCMFGFPGTGDAEAIATLDFAFKHQRAIDTLDVLPFYYAKHTVVPGVTVLPDPGREWALTQKYLPSSPGALSMEESDELARVMESYVWRQYPRWVQPLYRLASPWTPLSGGTPLSTAERERPLLCGTSS
ncbi:MAG TPA: radical SAM protein [Bryobacteraceae bacterium]|jgi:hypothetical protein